MPVAMLPSSLPSAAPITNSAAITHRARAPPPHINPCRIRASDRETRRISTSRNLIEYCRLPSMPLILSPYGDAPPLVPRVNHYSRNPASLIGRLHRATLQFV